MTSCVLQGGRLRNQRQLACSMSCDGIFATTGLTTARVKGSAMGLKYS